jgi:thiol:disulfide interchange protein DsbA
MRNAFVIGFAVLLLAACGQEEPAQPVAEEPAAAVDEAAVEAAAEATEAVADEAETTVVEESAAEPEEDEQAILLAQADTTPVAYDWQFKEGQHYKRLVPTQPTLGGADKIEVAEFFYYMCPHCYNFEPMIKEWAKDKPANVRFVQIPTMWNQLLVLHGRMYYTAEILNRNGALADLDEFQAAVYQQIHQRGNRLTSEGAIQTLFERFDVSGDDFSRVWSSFEVDQKMRIANDLARRYSVDSTPTIVVNGKYRFGAQEAGSYGKVTEVIDELIIRESAR